MPVARRRREGSRLGLRARQSERTDAPGLDAKLAEARRRHHGSGLARARRQHELERPLRDDGRRQTLVRRIEPRRHAVTRSYTVRAARTYSSTLPASTSSGTFPPSTIASLNALRAKLPPSAAVALARRRLISLCPIS